MVPVFAGFRSLHDDDEAVHSLEVVDQLDNAGAASENMEETDLQWNSVLANMSPFLNLRLGYVFNRHFQSIPASYPGVDDPKTSLSQNWSHLVQVFKLLRGGVRQLLVGLHAGLLVESGLQLELAGLDVPVLVVVHLLGTAGPQARTKVGALLHPVFFTVWAPHKSLLAGWRTGI